MPTGSSAKTTSLLSELDMRNKILDIDSMNWELKGGSCPLLPGNALDDERKRDDAYPCEANACYSRAEYIGEHCWRTLSGREICVEVRRLPVREEQFV